MDSVLDLYKTKLKEALTLVTDLTADKRMEAVSYWNELAEQLQDIIQKDVLTTSDNIHALNDNDNNCNDNLSHQQQLDLITTNTMSSSSNRGSSNEHIVQLEEQPACMYLDNHGCQRSVIKQLSQQQEQYPRFMNSLNTTLEQNVINRNILNLGFESIAQGQMPDFPISELDQLHEFNPQQQQQQQPLNDVDIPTKSASNEPYSAQLATLGQHCSPTETKQFNDNGRSTVFQTLSSDPSFKQEHRITLHSSAQTNNHPQHQDYILSNNPSPTCALISTSPVNNPTQHYSETRTIITTTTRTTSDIAINMHPIDPFNEIKSYNMMNQVHLNTSNSANSNNDFNNEHACQVCGKSGFSTKGNLKRHLRAHSGEKPFKCEYCDSRFTEKKSLKIHVRRHTGEKPYKCQICGKPFSQTGVLQSHMALHYNERKFECNKCGKAFRQRSQLKLHLMRHDGVKRLECSTCRAKFLTKGDLERHCRIHTGERPYACQLCGKTFTRQQSLNEHLNRHTGSKPYDCKYCDKSFSEMSACYKHAKTHKKHDDRDQTDDYHNTEKHVQTITSQSK